MDLVQVLFNFASITFMMFVFHEVGHLLYFQSKNIDNAKVTFKLWSLEIKTQGLNDTQYKEMLMAGIIAGIIPIVCATAFIDWYYIFMIIIYLIIGTRSDLKTIREITVNNENYR